MGSYGSYNSLERRVKVDDTFVNKINRILTSSLVFIVCYTAVVFLFQQLLVYFCKSYGYSPSSTYNQILNLPIEYTDWDRRTVTKIFSLVPLSILGLGISSMLLTRFMSGKSNIIRFILLWLGIICFNLFFTMLLISPAGKISYQTGLYQGFAVVFAWWHVNVFFLVMIMIFFLMVSIATGFFLSYEFLKFSYSQSLIQTEKGKNTFLFQTFFLPIIISIVPLMLLTNWYSWSLHMVMIANLFLMGVGMFIKNEVDKRGARTTRKDVLNHIPIIEGIVAVSIWLIIFYFMK